MNTVLKIENLHLTAGDAPLVRGVSLAIKRGETLCLVGESGSGKSLTALAALGLLPSGVCLKKGKISLLGEDASSFSAARWRQLRGRKMGMVFQEPLTSLNPVMRVGAQIEEVFRVHGQGGQNLRDRVLELLETVGLSPAGRFYAAYPAQLSGGQRQRVMIAQAIALKPGLLIADEPTTALDTTVQKSILDLLIRLRKEMGMALLFITHDFSVARYIGHKALVLRAGSVVEQGTVNKVFSKPAEAYTRQLIGALPEFSPKNAPPPNDGGSLLLEVENLCKTYRRKGWGGTSFEALKGVSFSLNRGETLAVVGESGSGKSTLARCVTSLLAFEEGRVLLQGREMSRLRGSALREARKEMHMVFQDPYASLNPRLKIGETVGEALRAHGVGDRFDRRAAVEELLADCGLPENSFNRYPHQLSGGQRQRVGIARALSMKPALVVADEPLSALDVSVQGQILALLEGLKKKYGLSYLFVSHDLRVVSRFAERVLVLHKGEVAEYGPTTQVLGDPQNAYTKSLMGSLL